MTAAEFKQTVGTLRDICEDLQEEMQFSVVIPEQIKDLDIREFDRLGSLLGDIRDEF